MTDIIVEDGSGVTGANSYITVEEVDNYVDSLGADPATSNDWGSLDDDQKGEAILVASQYLERNFRWYGLPYWTSRPEGGTPGPKTQSLQWPRTRNYDSKGVTIPAGTIPDELKQAQLYLTLQVCGDPASSAAPIENTGPLKSMTIDVLSMDFTPSGDPTVFVGTRYPVVELLLKNLGEIRTEDNLIIKKTENVY